MSRSPISQQKVACSNSSSRMDKTKTFRVKVHFLQASFKFHSFLCCVTGRKGISDPSESSPYYVTKSLLKSKNPLVSNDCYGNEFRRFFRARRPYSCVTTSTLCTLLLYTVASFMQLQLSTTLSGAACSILKGKVAQAPISCSSHPL